MQRITDQSKALHGGSSWNVDSTVRNEFGWGSHTAHTAIVTYENIHSHATVYASEDRILIILSSDPDYGSSYTEARNEDKYIIELADITDVVIKREPSIVGKLHKANMEVRRQSIFIFLKDGEACVVDTYDSDFSAKVIMMTWQANIARRSAGLGHLLSNEDRDIALAYYNETIKCLQTVTKHNEIIEILEDYSKEILTDLELKDYTFKSKELIINCIQIIENLMTLPAILKYDRGGKQTEILPVHGNHEKLETERKKVLQSTLNMNKNSYYNNDIYENLSTTSYYSDNNHHSRHSIHSNNSSSSNIEKEHMSIEQEQKLKIIAVDRMKIIFCIFKLFSSLLFSSECLSSRFALLLGPSPLDMESWLKLCIPDIYKLVCRALGCSETSTIAQIEAEIAITLQTEHIRGKVNQHTTSGSGMMQQHGEHINSNIGLDSSRYSVSSTPRKSVASVAESMLTPLSARMRTLAESHAPDAYAEAMAELTPLQQAIRDLQGMLSFDIHRIFGLAKAMVKGNHLHTNLYSQLAVVLGQPVAEGLLELKQVNCMGDIYVRQKYWEESLEDIVTRISGLLQDMASSPHITAGPTTALNTIGGLNSSAVAALSTHHSTGNINTPTTTNQSNMRLNFSLVGTNPHAFSTSSLHSGAGGVPIGFISPMVPPSPRSPVSTARSGSIALARPASRPYRTSSALLLNSLSPPVNHHSAINNTTSISAATIAAAISAAAVDTKGMKPPYSRKGPSHFFGSGHALPTSSHSSAYIPHSHGIADPTTTAGAEAECTEQQHIQVIEAPLRTQEILLFYLSTLLKALAMDSYKIREVMQTDLLSYWRNIIGMLNILCPRPVQDTDSVIEDYISSSSNSTGNSNNNSAKLNEAHSGNKLSSPIRIKSTKNTTKKKSKNNMNSATHHHPNIQRKSSKFVQNFLNLFSSIDKTKTETENIDHNEQNNNNKEIKDDILHTDYFDHRTIEECTIKIPILYVFDYGKPRYGLSHASWTLLVLARCAIEDVILRLKINPQIILTKPKMKIDNNYLTRLSKNMSINGMIAEGDSEDEDEFSVSRYDSEGSMDLGLDGSSIITPPVFSHMEEGIDRPSGGSGFNSSRIADGSSVSNSPGTPVLQIQIPSDSSKPNSFTMPKRATSPRIKTHKLH